MSISDEAIKSVKYSGCWIIAPCEDRDGALDIYGINETNLNKLSLENIGHYEARDRNYVFRMAKLHGKELVIEFKDWYLFFTDTTEDVKKAAINWWLDMVCSNLGYTYYKDTGLIKYSPPVPEEDLDQFPEILTTTWLLEFLVKTALKIEL